MSLQSRAEQLIADHGVPDALSVSQLYDRIDRAVRGAFPEEVWVTGEVRSMKVLTKGHCFIDLVDPAQADDPGAPTLSAKCWAGTWRTVRIALDRVGIALEAGMVVRLRGDVGLYKARGSVDFTVREIDTEALLGRVAAERARLVKALVDEGLYDRQRRLRLPVLPLRVGLVASPGTEGYNDFLGGLRGSGLAFAVTVAPTAVQGKDAPSRAAAAIADLQSEPVDIIVVVRGGGSKADLAAFDHEAVARAIATSDLAVWTGIGHTGDRSVADEVANRCCITPTECGRELAGLALDYWRHVRESGAIAARVARERLINADRHLAAHQRAVATGARIQLDRHRDGLGHRARSLRTVARGQVDTHAARLAVMASAAARTATQVQQGAGVDLVVRSRRLAGLPVQRLALEELRTAQRRRLLDAYDYQRQLERGYSVTRTTAGSVVRSVDGLSPGTVLATQLSDGTVDSTVTGTRADPTHDTTKGSV